MISKDLEKIFNEAESQKNNGNFSEAIKLFLNILKTNPNFEPALNNVANCYFQINETDLAEEYYLKCININQNNIITLNNLAILYLKIKKFQKALEYLSYSLEKNSDQEQVVEKKSYCLSALNLTSELDNFSKKFIQVYPKNKIILSYYRRNLFKIGKYKEGLEAYQKETGVIELDDDNINIISE